MRLLEVVCTAGIPISSKRVMKRKMKVGQLGSDATVVLEFIFRIIAQYIAYRKKHITPGNKYSQ